MTKPCTPTEASIVRSDKTQPDAAPTELTPICNGNRYKDRAPTELGTANRERRTVNSELTE
jgi:hypothetical protein